MGITPNKSNNFEQFSLMVQLLESTHPLYSNHFLGPVTARIVGFVTLPLAAVGDVFVHVSMTAVKTVTGIIACPWNVIVIISRRKEWQIPESLQLSSALIHLIQAAHIVSTIAVVIILYLINPDRAFHYIHAGKKLETQARELKAKARELEAKATENENKTQKLVENHQKEKEDFIRELEKVQLEREVQNNNSTNNAPESGNNTPLSSSSSPPPPPPPAPPQPIPSLKRAAKHLKIQRSASTPNAIQNSKSTINVKDIKSAREKQQEESLYIGHNELILNIKIISTVIYNGKKINIEEYKNAIHELINNIKDQIKRNQDFRIFLNKLNKELTEIMNLSH